MSPEELEDLEVMIHKLHVELRKHGAPASIRHRAIDVYSAIYWLQDRSG